jgi:hypothetical protein
MVLILNLSTGHVSPQYHVVYDDKFTTVDSLHIGTVPSNWLELYSHNRDLITDENFELSPDWIAQQHIQRAIYWLESHLDSEPISVQNVFHEDTLPSLNMGAYPVLSNE